MKYLRMMVLALVIGVFLMGTSAHADFWLQLTQGAFTTGQVNDGDVADINPLPDVITVSTSLGIFIVNVTTGIGNGILGTPNIEVCMDLNSVDVSSGGPGTLTLTLFEDGLSLPFDTYPRNVEAAIGGTTGGTVTQEVYLAGNPVTSTGPLGPGAFAATTYGSGLAPNLFSLMQVVTVNHGSGVVTSSFDSEVCVTPVPEPSTLLLLGSGLLGIAGYARVKFGRKKRAA